MMGVIVENGIVKEGTPICVPSKEVSFFSHLTSFRYVIIVFEKLPICCKLHEQTIGTFVELVKRFNSDDYRKKRKRIELFYFPFDYYLDEMVIYTTNSTKICIIFTILVIVCQGNNPFLTIIEYNLLPVPNYRNQIFHCASSIDLFDSFFIFYHYAVFLKCITSEHVSLCCVYFTKKMLLVVRCAEIISFCSSLFSVIISLIVCVCIDAYFSISNIFDCYFQKCLPSHLLCPISSYTFQFSLFGFLQLRLIIVICCPEIIKKKKQIEN